MLAFGLRRLTDALETGMMTTMNPRDDKTRTLNELLEGVESPELGPGPRRGTRPQAELETALKFLSPKIELSPTTRELIRALVFLWHDHLDTAHTISQGIQNPDGSFIHAILHRREPDYANSKYWWRRVGKHPCFPEIGRRVAELLKSKREHNLASELIPGGEWDPFALVDACEAASDLATSNQRVQLLREIQRIETEVALEHFLLREAN